MNSKEVLRTENLSFSYSGLKSGISVLNGVSFAVERGEVFSVLGPNGSGKTTLLKCLDGILKQEKGRIFIEERDIRELSVREIARKIAYVPQLHKPVFPYSVLEVVVMGRNPYLSPFARPGKNDMSIAIGNLESVGALHLKDKLYTELSGGEMQLVLIARALSQNPLILILDEPTAHLDFKNQIMVLKIVSGLSKDKGLTIIMSMHDPNYAMLYSTRIMYLVKGKTSGIDTPDKIINSKYLRRVYDIETDTVKLNGKRWIIPSY